MHIGAVTLYLESPAEGELGWILHKDYLHKGYAAEAANAVKAFASQSLQLDKLFALCDARNAASCRVMERLGMELESGKGTRTDKQTGLPVMEYKYSIRL